ncbi:MAG: hypothetical protein JOZ90_14795 [Alphaproteobacteria bacterium]|nr:hypothetical protein [Alphaproteobacteria bacterium]MBV9371404.1 hypothetical protein [Alphaproteobacteria bacterium]MBV9902341.1 hypothetical protein [Alphaproteobacteria bacterium]
MSDHDREPRPEPVRETERTTVIDAGGGGGDRRSIGIVVAVLLIGLLAIFFFVFRGGVKDTSKEVGVNVSLPTVETPDINVNLPDVNLPSKVELPDVDVRTKGSGDGNKAAD